MKRILYLLLSICFCCACQNETPADVPGKDGASIYLAASVETSVESRVPYQSASVPTPDEVLHAAVWASTTPNEYLSLGYNGKNNGSDVAIYASANFNDGQPKLLNEAVYPKEGNVYFVGFHPSTGWSTVDEKGETAMLTFNGSQDVMFAPRQTGTYDAEDTGKNIISFRFQHLLTWMKIKIKAENELVAKSWGKVKEMHISSKNKVLIDLTKEDDLENLVTYSGSADCCLPLYKVGADDVFPGSEGFELTHTSSHKEEAYVLCQPVIATEANGEPTAEYTLYIKTERQEVTLPIDLMKNGTEYFKGSTRAKFFTLNLTFMVGNTLMLQAEVGEHDWVLGNSGKPVIGNVDL